MNGRWSGLLTERSISESPIPDVMIAPAQPERKQKVVGIAPEAGLSPVTRWRSGFYHLANEARSETVATCAMAWRLVKLLAR